VSLEPKMYDMATETREHRERDGVELLVDPVYCSAAISSAPARSSSGPRWWWTAAVSTAMSSPTWR